MPAFALLYPASLTVHKLCFSSQGKEDGKSSKSRKSSGGESTEKVSKRKDGDSKSAVENRLLQIAMTVPQGGDDGGPKDTAPRGKTEAELSSASTRGSRHVKTDQAGSSTVDKVGVSPGDAGTKDKRKSGVESKEKSSGSKSQHKTKDSAAEKDRSNRQSERKAAEGSGKKKPRTESTSSESSDTSSSSSGSSSSGSSSSGSSSSTSSSSSEASASRKPRQQRATAKSKSDVQRVSSGGSKTHRSRNATKSADKGESDKALGKESSHRSRERADDSRQKEHSSLRGSGRWKEDSEAADRHRAAAESRKDGRPRSERDEKMVEYSPRRSRDDELERHGTPGSDRRLQRDSSLDYRQDRMTARYSSDHRRGGRYDADEHYDRIQHPADFEVGDIYRTGRHNCHYCTSNSYCCNKPCRCSPVVKPLGRHVQ